jgi:hypothetical protein
MAKLAFADLSDHIFIVQARQEEAIVFGFFELKARFMIQCV